MSKSDPTDGNETDVPEVSDPPEVEPADTDTAYEAREDIPDSHDLLEGVTDVVAFAESGYVKPEE